MDKNEKSQDKRIVGYFSVVVLDGASALGKMEAWNPQMFQSSKFTKGADDTSCHPKKIVIYLNFIAFK